MEVQVWTGIRGHLPPQIASVSRFDTKGLRITFVSADHDAQIFSDTEGRFEVNVTELPEEIVISTYTEQGQ